MLRAVKPEARAEPEAQNEGMLRAVKPEAQNEGMLVL
jgi:hypothetical protein